MMADDWRVGDKAVCIDNGPLFNSRGREDLVLGRVYVVHGFEIDRIWSEPCLIVRPAERSASIRRFRKIRPDKHEPCEEEFVTLIKREQVRA